MVRFLDFNHQWKQDQGPCSEAIQISMLCLYTTVRIHAFTKQNKKNTEDYQKTKQKNYCNSKAIYVGEVAAAFQLLLSSRCRQHLEFWKTTDQFAPQCLSETSVVFPDTLHIVGLDAATPGSEIQFSYPYPPKASLTRALTR